MAAILYPNETVGDYYNCNCPWCGKNNVYPAQGVIIEVGIIRNFSKDCHYCQKEIFYRFSYEVQVIAGREHYLERFGARPDSKTE